jgi:hypothetical protein
LVGKQEKRELRILFSPGPEPAVEQRHPAGTHRTRFSQARCWPLAA